MVRGDCQPVRVFLRNGITMFISVSVGAKETRDTYVFFSVKRYD